MSFQLFVPSHLNIWYHSSSLHCIGHIPCSLFLLTFSVSKLLFSTILFFCWLSFFFILHMLPAFSCSLNYYAVFVSFLGWGETESTWYTGHYLAYCTRTEC
jgi:hypothetical protein